MFVSFVWCCLCVLCVWLLFAGVLVFVVVVVVVVLCCCLSVNIVVYCLLVSGHSGHEKALNPETTKDAVLKALQEEIS
jgi:hypothetical protein